MYANAVLLQQPKQIAVEQVALSAPAAGDVVVDIAHSGVSTGTERLLWSGKMPAFPGMGYPLVPGYESVGTVVDAADSDLHAGQSVFVPGASCFGEIRGLFGATASRLVVPAKRVVPIDAQLRELGILLALAATAYHALAAPDAVAPQLIVGHGVLGRLLARIAIARGDAPPTVWETNPIRAHGAHGYAVMHPDGDDRRDYASIYDVSGDASLLDSLIGRISLGGEIVLAGFYSERLSFSFPPAFMREARLRVAAEWKPTDLTATRALIETGKLSLDGLITHRHDAHDAPNAYPIAFDDPACLKMVLTWS